MVSDISWKKIEIEKKFNSYKNQFLGEKLKKLVSFFFVVFFKILLKFSDFVISDNCIGKIISKYIGLQPVYIQKWIWS